MSWRVYAWLSRLMRTYTGASSHASNLEPARVPRMYLMIWWSRLAWSAINQQNPAVKEAVRGRIEPGQHYQEPAHHGVKLSPLGNSSSTSMNLNPLNGSIRQHASPPPICRATPPTLSITSRSVRHGVPGVYAASILALSGCHLEAQIPIQT